MPYWSGPFLGSSYFAKPRPTFTPSPWGEGGSVPDSRKPGTATHAQQFAKNPLGKALVGQVGAGGGEIESLQLVGARVHRDQRLVGRFDALDGHLGARLVQQLDGG